MWRLSLVLCTVFVSSVVIIHGQDTYQPNFEYQHKVLLSLVKQEVRNNETDDMIDNLKARLADALAAIDELNAAVQVLQVQDPSSGSTYVRWGKRTCPEGVEKVYDGWAAGSYYTHTGGGANLQCLPKDPIFGIGDDNTQTISLIYGTEYEYGGKLQNHEVPCSVCWIPRTSNIMLPARNECYPGWRLEYNGHLAGPSYTYSRGEYVCVDEDTEVTEGSSSSNNNGALLYFVEARCGALPCSTYPSGKDLTCAVCSYSPTSNQNSYQPTN